MLRRLLGCADWGTALTLSFGKPFHARVRQNVRRIVRIPAISDILEESSWDVEGFS